MKLWERVIESKLRKEISISENHLDFMPGISTAQAIHLLRRLKELHRNRKKDLHTIIVDLKKAYDRVPRKVLWKCLDKKGVSLHISMLLKICTMWLWRGLGPSEGTHDFLVDISLNQGSALSPFLFAWVMDELKGNQDEMSWCMLFVDDIVLIDETRNEVKMAT